MNVEKAGLSISIVFIVTSIFLGIVLCFYEYLSGFFPTTAEPVRIQLLASATSTLAAGIIVLIVLSVSVTIKSFIQRHT